jgi:Ni,Fe-hydrogenase maturation factor
MERSNKKDIVSKVAYLIGVKKATLYNQFETDLPGFLKEMDENKAARIIRSLCKLRMTMMHRFKKVDDILRYDLKNLKDIDFFDRDDIIQLEKWEVYVTLANSRSSLYMEHFNELIQEHIDDCKDLFPEWLKWEYLRSLFLMPKNKKIDVPKKEFEKYMANMEFYPYQAYIYWKQPSNCGNILFNDQKFASLLYDMHNDFFAENEKVLDAGEGTKTTIYDFIQRSDQTVVIVDCENSDVYKLYATLKNLNQEELQKVKKIILFDDVHTTKAWSCLSHFTSIEVEHVEVERVNNYKSLVDIKMTAGACKEFYSNQIHSFILVSSDSDFWGLISSLSTADFLVMIEYSKCGKDIKEALEQNGIFYCSIDDFCSGNIAEFKNYALQEELQFQLQQAFSLNAHTLLETVYRNCRMQASETEQKNFYDRYLRNLQLTMDTEGNYEIKAKK